MRRVAAAIAALAAVGIVAGVGTLVLGGSSKPKVVVIPESEGRDLQLTFDHLRRLGLRVAIPEPIRFQATSSPFVYKQRPATGSRVDRGSLVTLDLLPGLMGTPIGRGKPPAYRVPDFRGETLTDAVRWTEDKNVYWEADLPPLPASNAEHLFDAYEVVGQSPRPGAEIREGTLIPNGIRLTPLSLKVELR